MSKPLEKSSFSIDQITESEYVLGIRKHNTFKVIDVMLPNEWSIPDILFPENTPISIAYDETNKAYSFFSETKQFSDIYQVICAVVQYNKELEEKVLIFNKLQVELQRLFEQTSLEDFRQLRLVTQKTITLPASQEKQKPEPAPKKEEKVKENNDGEVLKP